MECWHTCVSILGFYRNHQPTAYSDLFTLPFKFFVSFHSLLQMSINIKMCCCSASQEQTAQIQVNHSHLSAQMWSFTDSIFVFLNSSHPYSDHHQGTPGCTYDEDWRSITYCPGQTMFGFSVKFCHSAFAHILCRMSVLVFLTVSHNKILLKHIFVCKDAVQQGFSFFSPAYICVFLAKPQAWTADTQVCFLFINIENCLYRFARAVV